MQDTDSWSLTVVRTNGLSFLRPEKSWRPIITINVNDHQHYETVLGCDGQNTNMKALFRFQASLNCRVDFRIWHRSQSKKKRRKRILVATACHSLGELLKRHASEPRVEVRLVCEATHRRRGASRGKPHNGAVLIVAVRPPASSHLFRPPQSEDGSSLSDALSDSTHDVFLPPPSPVSDDTSSGHDEDEGYDDPPRTKGQIRGYIIDSDDNGSDDGWENDDYEQPLLRPADNWLDVADIECIQDPPDVGTRISTALGTWLAASVLPTYTETIEVKPPTWCGERLFSLFTTYNELKHATLDSQYESVFVRLQMEWTYVGGLLVALAAVDTAVFAIAPGSLFNVDRYAQNAIAASSIASGLGISCDAWFLLRYNWATLQTFKTRARDVYGSYFFFALSSRLPSLSMLTSTISLMAYLGRVAYNAWPEAVVVACVVFGVLMTLQFLVFGAHWCFNRMVDAGRAVLRVFSGRREASPPPYTIAQ